MPKTTEAPLSEKTTMWTLTVKSATLQTFTDAFTKQTGVLFSYESALASMPMGDVSVRESNAPLERILNNVFTKRGFRYKIVDRTVVLTYDRTAEPQRKNSVTGRVCDAAGSPLVGATVLVKDSTRGTTTGSRRHLFGRGGTRRGPALLVHRLHGT